MTRCIKCSRPLKYPTATGMGRVCAKNATPPPVHDRDLFGFDIPKAVEAARARIEVHIRSAVIEAHIANRRAFVAARKSAGVWRA